MHRLRLIPVLATLGAAGALLSWWLVVAAGPASGRPTATPAAATVPVIHVTAGKPSELAFTLSNSAIPAAGKVTFEVTNAGTIAHDFEICSAPSANNGNACKGTTTPMLSHGQSASLTVTLKKGLYEYLCTVKGHAQAGMKGVLEVAATPVIHVAAGKPTELAFRLSTPSIPVAGKVTFNVTNVGTSPHDFEICSAPTTTNGGAFTCKGTTTPMLKHGQSASITVTLRKGVYEFLCTVAGQAQAGMRGVFGVAVSPTASAGGTGGAGGNGSTTTVAAAPCNNPSTTAVSVNELEYKFVLSQYTIPCGKVTFNQTNGGQIEHNFDVVGLTNGAGVGPFLNPGQSASTTMTLTPGTYSIICDVATHVSLGMSGSITVTG